MPLISYSELHPDGRLRDVPDRLARMAPGLAIASGQATSGKLTLLLALVGRIAARKRKVVLLCDQPAQFDVFRPLPGSWSEVLVPPARTAWQEALQACPAGSLVVVCPLNRENAAAAAAAPAKRWVFATLDTVVAGLDTSYALREMGVSYEDFAATVRCVWSQFLVPALCGHCARDAAMSADERDLLHELPPSARVRIEVGCDQCEGRGTAGRISIPDVAIVTDDVRTVVRGALAQGVSIALRDDLHIDAHTQARELLARGDIGIGTYRDAIQRNPLLRAQNALDLARRQSIRLSETFDTFVASLWLDIDVLTAVADRTSAGVVVAGADGHLRFANRLARDALRPGGELTIVDQRLVATGSLKRSLAEALAAATSSQPRASRLQSRTRDTKREIFVAPLPTVRGFAQGMRRLALVVLSGTRRPESLPSSQDLRQYFDLTPAESLVAQLLCAGLVPKEIARRLDVSVPTVRSHLRALLDKTGTSRQTELVSLLSSLPAGAPAPAGVV